MIHHPAGQNYWVILPLCGLISKTLSTLFISHLSPLTFSWSLYTEPSETLGAPAESPILDFFGEFPLHSCSTRKLSPDGTVLSVALSSSTCFPYISCVTGPESGKSSCSLLPVPYHFFLFPKTPQYEYDVIRLHHLVLLFAIICLSTDCWRSEPLSLWRGPLYL